MTRDDAEVEVLVLAIGPDAPGRRLVAIAAADVREVAGVDRITEFPGAPEDVPGIAAVRGQIVPILDLVPDARERRSVVVLVAGARTLALAGGVPVRVAAAVTDSRSERVAAVRLWSGRLLPVAGTVRLLDVSRPNAAGGPALPLLDAAALIRDVVDDSDGER